MSANPFYLDHGYTPEYRFQSFSGVGTLAIWAPRSTTNFAHVTALQISANTGGSITFYWATTSGASSSGKVAEFFLAGSASLNPHIGAIACTTQGATLWANVSGGGSDGFKVSAQGFEIPGAY